MALAIAGAVDPAAVEEGVRDLLGDWEPGDGDRSIPPAPESVPTVHRIAGAFESTAVEIAWPVPPLGHPDIPALEFDEFFKFCDPHLFDYPYLRDVLEKEGIPSMVLEMEGRLPSKEQFKTRCEAFMEMIY